MWPVIESIGHENRCTHYVEDAVFEDNSYKNRRTFSMMPSYLNVAFIHAMREEESAWVRAHEEGARKLEEIMGDQVIVQRYAGVGTGELAERVMEIAIKNGAEILFASTASLLNACRRVSARHPEVKSSIALSTCLILRFFIMGADSMRPAIFPVRLPVL